ncbi:cytochrome P450 [Mycena pura]|uniref:Cytochrome P450 n=1 Tax=Mycena pura TaxID=153505 RepID=A0AAD6YQV4_9AGAR|nr:cytochrome P450 [Mycena pura]
MLRVSLCLAAVFVAYRAVRFLSALHAHGYVKGARPLLDPHSFPGNAIPSNWWHMGFMWPWIRRKHAHFNHTHDLTTLIPLLSGGGAYFAASVAVARQVWGNEAKTHLVKPKDFTTESVWGSSVASANGDDWKRHRRVVAPAFTHKMFSKIVEESALVYDQMKGDFCTTDVHLTNLHALLLRYTFVTICRCGFGMSVDWKQSSSRDEVAVFDRALSVASGTIIPRLIFPKWVWRLPIQRRVCASYHFPPTLTAQCSLRKIDDSWKTVLTLLDAITASRQAQYAARKSLGDDEIDDLFTKLVSSTDGAAKYALEPPDVDKTANMMSLLFAGYETTGSALMSTLVLLGLHPEEQDAAYAEIIREIPSAENMSLPAILNLKHVLACMHEAHRLVPATITLPRDVPEDIILHSTRPVERNVLVKKGSRVIVDIMAVCHNPHDFPAPEAFRPARWYGVPDPDVIMFGAGPRMCVGRRFAQTEAVSFLARFLRDWRVETPLRDGETRAAAMERVMAGASMCGTAFALGEVPVRIVARK